MRSIISFFAIAMIVLSACQKELGLDILASTDSTYLDKIYEYDSINGRVKLQLTTTYEYDDRKRVTRKSVKDENAVFDDITTYFYTGNEMLPHRLTKISYPYPTTGNINNDTTTGYFIYDSQGLNMRDSIVYNSHTLNGNYHAYSQTRSRSSYRYDDHRIFMERSTESAVFLPVFNTGSGLVFDTLTLDNNSNLIMQKNYFRDANTGQLNISKSEFTYDDKPNPFARLSDFRTLSFLERNKNNLLTIKDSVLFTLRFEDRRGGYTYRADGYPVIQKYPNVSLPGHYRKFVYTYKIL